MTPYRAVPPDARLRQAGPKLTRPTCSGGGAARVKCGWNLRGGSPQLYAFSLMFPVCGGRMLASMSEIDPRAETPLVDWSELSVSGLLPTGTVTLLLADVEGSTRLWETPARRDDHGHGSVESDSVGDHRHPRRRAAGRTGRGRQLRRGV